MGFCWHTSQCNCSIQAKCAPQGCKPGVMAMTKCQRSWKGGRVEKTNKANHKAATGSRYKEQCNSWSACKPVVIHNKSRSPARVEADMYTSSVQTNCSHRAFQFRHTNVKTNCHQRTQMQTCIYHTQHDIMPGQEQHVCVTQSVTCKAGGFTLKSQTTNSRLRKS